MIIRLSIALVLLLLITSCASLGKKSKDTHQFSVAEFPYIEKFHEAVRLKTSGQIKESIAAFENCLTMKQDDDAVYYALSQLYLQKEDAQRSSECIEKAAKLDPNNVWYTQELAYMYFGKGSFSEAIKQFSKLTKLQPHNVEWLYGYAESLLKGGKTAEAIKALDRTEEEVGAHPELALQKFKMYIEIKQAEKGVAEVEKALKLFPDDPQLLSTLVDYYFQSKQATKAIELLEKLVKANPENGRAHSALADVYRQQGKQKEAYKELKLAFEADDVDIDAKMKILINIQETSFKVDPEVYELVDIMVAKYPTEAKAHSIRGDYLNTAGDEKEALQAYKEALKFSKKEYPIWRQVLIMEYETADFYELYKDSKECLEYFPTIPTVYLLNGIGAVQTRRFSEAISSLEAGKELIVNEKSLEAEMYAQIGEAQFGLKNAELGKISFEKAMVLDPKSNLIRNNFAYQLAESKIDLDKANTLIDAVLKEENNVAQFIDTKGLILFQKGDYSESLKFFEDAYHLLPSDMIIVEHLGDAWIKMGNAEKAIDYWKRAKVLGAENKSLEKKIEKKDYYEPIY